MSFNVLTDGTIVDVIRNKTIQLEDGKIKSEFYSVEGDLVFYTVDDINAGTREIIQGENSGRTESGRSWLSYFDECFGKLMGPIPNCNICNTLYGNFVSGITVGLYPVLGGVVCGGVAVGQVNRGYLTYYYPITTVANSFPLSVDDIRFQLNIQLYGG